MIDIALKLVFKLIFNIYSKQFKENIENIDIFVLKVEMQN